MRREIPAMAHSGEGVPAAEDGVFPISVTAQLLGTGVQNLRAYEKAGLVEPSRTPGGTRLYSADDIVRLRRVLVLLDAGLNLAGIAMVLELQDDNARLRAETGPRPATGDLPQPDEPQPDEPQPDEPQQLHARGE